MKQAHTDDTRLRPKTLTCYFRYFPGSTCWTL